MPKLKDSLAVFLSLNLVCMQTAAHARDEEDKRAQEQLPAHEKTELLFNGLPNAVAYWGEPSSPTCSSYTRFKSVLVWKKYETGRTSTEFLLLESRICEENMSYFYYEPFGDERPIATDLYSASGATIGFHMTPRPYAVSSREAESTAGIIDQYADKRKEYKFLLLEEQLFQENFYSYELRFAGVSLAGCILGIWYLYSEEGESNGVEQTALAAVLSGSALAIMSGMVYKWFDHKKRVQKIERLGKELSEYYIE